MLNVSFVFWFVCGWNFSFFDFLFFCLCIFRWLDFVGWGVISTNRSYDRVSTLVSASILQAIASELISTQLYGIKYSYLIWILFKQIYWYIDQTLTGATILNQSWPKCNDDEESTLHSAELQNWNLTTRYSLVSYLGHKIWTCESMRLK